MQTSLYSQKLLAILQHIEKDDVDGTRALHDLQFWCIALGAASRCLLDTERIMFDQLLSQALLTDYNDDPEAFLELLRRFVWDDTILDIETIRLQSRL
jgi:hypothetical protein